MSPSNSSFGAFLAFLVAPDFGVFALCPGAPPGVFLGALLGAFCGAFLGALCAAFCGASRGVGGHTIVKIPMISLITAPATDLGLWFLVSSTVY
jgi:hypothetical protein